MVAVVLVGAAVLLTHLVAAVRAGELVASLGEARLAAAAFAARSADLVADPLPFPDRFAARQLAVVETVLPLDGLAVVDAARAACLVLGVLVALAVWPLLRGLGLSAPAAVAGVAVAGVLAPVVALHAGITAGGPASLWLTVSAALAVRARSPVSPAAAAAGAAALLAVVTAPPAAVVVLVLAAHAVLDRAVLSEMRPAARLATSAALAVAAAGTAVLSLGGGPLAGVGGPVVGLPVALAGLVVGLAVVVAAWLRAPWMRPLLSPAAVLLVVLLVPGPSRVAVALLVVPLLAVAVAVLVDELPAAPFIPALVTVAVVAAAVTAVLPVRAPVRPGPSLAAWVGTELDPGTVLRADALDRAELVAGGVEAARLRSPADPVVPGELVVVADRPRDGAGPDPVGCGGATVAEVARGAGGAPTRLCATDATTGSVVAAERPARARLGTALAENPALELAPAAEQALRSGDVDSRVVILLAAMTGARRLAVADFPPVELDAEGAPRRRMLLSTVDGVAAAAEPLPLLRTWLAAQRPPFAPGLVSPTGPGLLVGFPAPTSTGLLSP